MVIDVAMSVTMVAISYESPLLLFGTLGTLWWYLLSRAVEMTVVRAPRTRRPTMD
jgi:hypothetical protein